MLSPVVATTRPSDAPRADDETLDLAPYLREVLRRWNLILGLVLAGAAAGFAVTRFMTPEYEAVSTLMVIHPKAAAQPLSERDTASFRALVENQTILAEAIKSVNLQGGEQGLTPRVLLAKHVRVEEVPRTNLVRVRVRTRAAGTSAALANAISERAVDLNNRLNRAEGAGSRTRLLEGRTEAHDKFKEAEGALLHARQRFQVELRQKDVEAALEGRSGLLPLQAEIAGERAKLAAAEAELKQRQPVLTFRRSLDGDPALLETLRGARVGPDGLLRLSTSTEAGNPVYEELDTIVATSRAKLAQLEHSRRELVEVRGIGAASMKRLDELYAAEITLARLQTEYDIAKRSYEDVATRYEQVRTDLASFSSQLQIVDPAQVPDRAEPRGGIRGVLVGVTLGLLIGCGVAFGAVLRRRLQL